MPRSVSLFKEIDMNPLPMRTDHLSKQKINLNLGLIFPGVSGLYKTKRAIFEYLGLIWEKLRTHT